MDTFLFALNAVAPITLMMALGYFLKRIGALKSDVANGMYKLSFQLFLPAMLFVNLYEGGGLRSSDISTALFICAACAVMFAAGLVIVHFTVPDAKQKGVVLQCIFRSNFAIIGMPLATSLGGDEGARLAAVASVVAIPLFNSLAVVSLSIFRRDENGEKVGAGKILKGIVTNPLIIGVCLALVVLGLEKLISLTGLNVKLGDTHIVYPVIKSIANVTSPLMLLALGAKFEFSAVRELIKPITIGTVCRLIVMPFIVIGSAMLFFPNFTPAHFALLVAFSASPISVSSSVMASEMGCDGTLAGQLVVWTTVFSMISLFLIIVALRTIGVL